MNKQQLLGALPRAVDTRPVVIEADQDVYDIMNLISYAHKKNAASYDCIANYFYDGDLYATCEKLFIFCKQNIEYDVESEEVQTVRSPRRILENGRGDCKHYASFIAGVLDALKRKGVCVDWCYRFSSYRFLNELPSHVFVVVVDIDGEEIWVDPVLDYFDEKKPYTYAQDRIIKPSQVSGCNCYNGMGYVPNTVGDTGATVKTVGGAIMAVAPAVAVVVPVGTIVAAAAEVVGGLMELVGGLLKSYKTSTQVRWLTQLYQYYVLGDGSVTSDHKVNENYTLQAQSWFSLALGVPIYDRRRVDALKSSASAYVGLSNAPDTKNIDASAVAHAAAIAATMDYKDAPGGWANYPPANIIITPPASQQTNMPQTGNLTVTPSGQLIETANEANILPWILIGGAALLLL